MAPDAMIGDVERELTVGTDTEVRSTDSRHWP